MTRAQQAVEVPKKKEENTIAHQVIPREQLYDGANHLFRGTEHDGVPLSFFWVQYSTLGRGPKLHKHPYEEIFVVEEGKASFTLGDQALLVEGGNVVIVSRNTPHKFVNSTTGMLHLLAIHCSPYPISEYLE